MQLKLLKDLLQYFRKTKTFLVKFLKLEGKNKISLKYNSRYLQEKLKILEIYGLAICMKMKIHLVILIALIV